MVWTKPNLEDDTTWKKGGFPWDDPGGWPYPVPRDPDDRGRQETYTPGTSDPLAPLTTDDDGTSVDGNDGYGDVAPFSYMTPAYGGPMAPRYKFSKVPGFTAPEFQAPSVSDMMAEPGYQFRVQQGLGALENAAAARGILRTGGTLKGLMDYGQNYASAEYSNVFDRALQGYDRRYQGARDEYAPNLIEWQTLMSAMQRQKDLEWQREWDSYVYGIDDEFRRQQMLYQQPPI